MEWSKNSEWNEQRNVMSSGVELENLRNGVLRCHKLNFNFNLKFKLNLRKQAAGSLGIDGIDWLKMNEWNEWVIGLRHFNPINSIYLLLLAEPKENKLWNEVRMNDGINFITHSACRSLHSTSFHFASFRVRRRQACNNLNLNYWMLASKPQTRNYWNGIHGVDEKCTEWMEWVKWLRHSHLTPWI